MSNGHRYTLGVSGIFALLTLLTLGYWLIWSLARSTLSMSASSAISPPR